jgi:ATP-dependent Clp protease adaptor protein ClpS
MSTQTIEKTSVENDQRIAPRWNVILLNDDFHSVPFVIAVLQEIFKKEFQAAVDITLSVHNTGRGIAATTTKERAELYVEQVKSMPEGAKGPLGVEMEPCE